MRKVHGHTHRTHTTILDKHDEVITNRAARDKRSRYRPTCCDARFDERTRCERTCSELRLRLHNFDEDCGSTSGRVVFRRNARNGAIKSLFIRA